MSWSQWPQTAGTVAGWPGAGVAPAAQAVGALAPTPGTPYTAEQWAAMQQQNWQQWVQWQQQYQQWQQQYGEQYQKSLAMSGQTAAAVPIMPVQPQPPLPLSDPNSAPPLPSDTRPPLPPEEPPRNLSVTVAAPSVTYNASVPPPNIPPPPPQQQPVQIGPQQPMQIGPQQPMQIGPQQPMQIGPQQPMQIGSHQPMQNSQGQNYGQNRYVNTSQPPPSLLSLSVTKPPFVDNQQPRNQNFRSEYPNKRSGDFSNDKFEDAKKNRWEELTPEKNEQKQWNVNKPQQRNQQWNRNKPEVQRPHVEELSDAEKNFDKQFEQWEAQFNKWKEQNAGHPDKQQYREYEAKWESWRTQLLDRREQMRKKRLGLLGSTSPAQATSTKPNTSVVVPPVDTVNPPATDVNPPNQIKPISESSVNKDLPLPNPKQSMAPVATTSTKSHEDKIENKEEINTSETDISVLFSQPPKEQRTNIRFRRASVKSDTDSTADTSFLKSSLSSEGGIPGLDLVKDDEGKVPDNKEDENKSETDSKLPDFEAISKGINSILGDQKLMSMLSMVAQNKKIEPFNNPDSKNNTPNSNNPMQDDFNNSYKSNESFENQSVSNEQFGQNQYRDYDERCPNMPNRGPPAPNDFRSPLNFNQPPNNFNQGPPNRGHDNLNQNEPNTDSNEFNNFPPNRNDFGAPKSGPNEYGSRGPHDFVPPNRGPNNFNPENRGPLNEFNQGPPNNFNIGPNNFNQGPPGRGKNFNRGPGDQGLPNRGPTDFNQGPPNRGAGDFNQGPPNRGRPGNFYPSSQGPPNRGPGGSHFRGSGEFNQGPPNRGPGDFNQDVPNRGGPVEFNKAPPNRGPGDFNQSQLNRGPGDFKQGPPNRGPGDFNQGPQNRGPGDFNQGPPNRGSGDFNHGPPNRGPGAFNQGPPNRAPGDFNQGPPNRGPNDFNQGPPNRGPGDFNQGPPNNRPGDFNPGPSNRGPTDFNQDPSSRGPGEFNKESSDFNQEPFNRESPGGFNQDPPNESFDFNEEQSSREHGDFNQGPPNRGGPGGINQGSLNRGPGNFNQGPPNRRGPIGINQGPPNRGPADFNQGPPNRRPGDFNQGPPNRGPCDFNQGPPNRGPGDFMKGPPNRGEFNQRPINRGGPADFNQGQQNRGGPGDFNQGPSNRHAGNFDHGPPRGSDDFHQGPQNRGLGDFNQRPPNRGPNDMNQGPPNRGPNNFNQGPNWAPNRPRDDFHGPPNRGPRGPCPDNQRPHNSGDVPPNREFEPMNRPPNSDQWNSSNRGPNNFSQEMYSEDSENPNQIPIIENEPENYNQNSDFNRNRPGRWSNDKPFPDPSRFPNSNLRRSNSDQQIPTGANEKYWDEALILKPVTVIDYEHKSINKEETNFMEPVQTFDYGHTSKNVDKKLHEPEPLHDFPPRVNRFSDPGSKFNRGNSRDRDYSLNQNTSKSSENREDESVFRRKSYDNRRLQDRFDRFSPKTNDRFPPKTNDRFPQTNDRFPPQTNERFPSKTNRFFEKSFEVDKDGYEDVDDFEEDPFEEPEFNRASNERELEPFVNKPNPGFELSKLGEKTSTVTMIEDLLVPPGRNSRPPRIAIILRGPPGSGKTFLAKLIKDKEVEQGGCAPRILSLDDYFMVEQDKEIFDNETGRKTTVKEMVYEYEECMELAYRQSLEKAFKKTITDGFFPFIILDCVNDKTKHFSEMWSFAKQNGFQVYVCQMELDIAVCTKRNIHHRSEIEIERLVAGWEQVPSHYLVLDATSLIQSGSISEVEMEEVIVLDDEENDDDYEGHVISKWERMEPSGEKLARLDGTSKPLRPRATMEDYLQLDDDFICEDKPGQKRVRWADLEEKRKQDKMRAIGFVVGGTNWDRMMDPTQGGSALTQTKYIERVRRF